MWLRFALVCVISTSFSALATDSEQTIRREYESGEQALRRGDLGSAADAFRHVLAIAPENAGAHTNLGVVYMRQQKWNDAVTQLTLAERLSPRVPGIRLNIGLAYYRQGKYGEAIPPFESVIRDVPQSSQARRLLGLCYFFTERYAESASILEPLWTESRDDLSYLYVLALTAGNSGNRDLEERALRTLLETGKGSPEYHLLIGKAYLNHDENDKALAEFQLAAVGNANLPFLHYNLGVVWFRKHALEKAKREFERDAHLEPDVAYNYDQLGTICQLQNNNAAAFRYYVQAVKLDPELGTSWYGLAKIYAKRSKYLEALKALDRAGSIDPQSASVHYLRGQIFQQLGRSSESKKEMAEVRRLHQQTRDKLEQRISGAAYHDPQLAKEP